LNIEQLVALAFGEDRAAAREALVAGSVEHSYWTAIYLQHEDKLAEVDALIARWPHKDSHGESLRERPARRQLLLRAGVDLDSVLKELRRQSGTRLDAQRERTVEANRSPSTIDAEIDLERECDRLIQERRNDLSAFKPWALDLLVARWDKLTPTQRQQLVARLPYSARPEVIPIHPAMIHDGILRSQCAEAPTISRSSPGRFGISPSARGTETRGGRGRTRQDPRRQRI
jgi:hypothetical protein